MELENTQNNGFEVIENGNSWVPIPVTTPSETGTSTATKMTMPSTTEEKTCKKNDVKARSSTAHGTLAHEHQLTSTKSLDSIFNRLQRLVSRLEILGVVTPPEDLNALLSMRQEGFYQRTRRKIIIDRSNTVGYDKSKVECFNCHKMRHFARECRAPRSKDNRNWNQEGRNSDILTGFKAATYKRGLATLEDQIVKYREHEVLFSEEIALLKRSVGHKEYQMGLLRAELEKVKQEKEGFEFKIAKFDKSAKDLEQLDSSLKPTTGCDKESDNFEENTDDSLEQHQMTDTETSSFESSLKINKDRKEKFFYPANHDWVSDDEDEVESHVVKTDIPTATKIEKPVRKQVRYAEMYRFGIKVVNTAKPKDAHNAVKRNRFNTVKASACWVWMPKNRVIDHVSKNNNASVTLKRFDYIDAQGRFKWMHRLRGGRSAAKTKNNDERLKDQEDEVFERILSKQKV
ncbi:putative ribonuclease H-like domain-containing protein [Tanacetum coccineum]